MNDVYVIGADLIKFGRYPDRTPAQLGAEAALLALDDAGLTAKDIGAIYCSCLFQAMSSMGQQVLRQIGPRLKEALREGDSLSRLGGDEFAVVVATGDEASARTSPLRTSMTTTAARASAPRWRTRDSSAAR